MDFLTVKPEEWLTETHLTEQGREVRRAYWEFCEYFDRLGLQSQHSARSKYFLQYVNYWTLPDGYALPPHTINLCVNNTCNLKCSYCDFGMDRDDTFYYKYNVVDDSRNIELDFDALKSMVDQVAWSRPIVRASYREPMLYKHLIPLLEYTKSRQMPFWLLTNGFNLKRHARRMVELDIDSVRLSLDGPEETHDEVCRVPGAFRKMIDGVKELIAARRELNTRTQIGFYFTITHLNYNHILDTVQALEKEGILKDVFVSFHWLLYTTEEMAREHNELHAQVSAPVEESTVQSVHLDQIDLGEMSRQAKLVEEKYPESEGYRIHFRPNFELEHLLKYVQTNDFPVDNPRCRVLWYDLTVNPSGDVRAFHHCLLPPTGNIYNDKIMDIWNGEVMREQRRNLQHYGAYRGCARCWGLYSLLEDQRRAKEIEKGSTK